MGSKDQVESGKDSAYLASRAPTPWHGIIMNIVASVGCVISNKYLWEKFAFNYMITLTFLHLVFSAAVVHIMMFYGYFAYAPCSLKDSLPLASFSLMSIVFMNLNLAYNSVGFYQMSKLMCIPATLIIQYILFKATVTIEMILTLALVLVGVGIATVTDISLNFAGTVFACVAVVVTCNAQILTNYMQGSLALDHMQLLSHVLPLMAIGAFFTIPVFEDPYQLLDTGITPECTMYILISCSFASLVNISNYLVIGRTSPVTYQVVGHFKTISIIVIGFWLFNYEIIPKNVAGFAIALTGVVLYSEVKRRESAQAKEAAK